MGVLIDETGNEYGRLTVIRRAGATKGGDVKWLCHCECGNEKVIIGALLRRGSTRSCGCYRSEAIANATKAWQLPEGEAAFNRVLSSIKRHAENRGYKWALEKEQVRKLIAQPCFYCGLPYSNDFGDERFNGGIKYNGLDRIDSSLGYVAENVVPCCRHCNVAKSDRSIDDYKEWARRLYHHWASEGEQ